MSRYLRRLVTELTGREYVSHQNVCDLDESRETPATLAVAAALDPLAGVQDTPQLVVETSDGSLVLGEANAVHVPIAGKPLMYKLVPLTVLEQLQDMDEWLSADAKRLVAISLVGPLLEHYRAEEDVANYCNTAYTALEKADKNLAESFVDEAVQSIEFSDHDRSCELLRRRLAYRATIDKATFTPVMHEGAATGTVVIDGHAGKLIAETATELGHAPVLVDGKVSLAEDVSSAIREYFDCKLTRSALEEKIGRKRLNEEDPPADPNQLPGTPGDGDAAAGTQADQAAPEDPNALPPVAGGPLGGGEEDPPQEQQQQGKTPETTDCPVEWKNHAQTTADAKGESQAVIAVGDGEFKIMPVLLAANEKGLAVHVASPRVQEDVSEAHDGIQVSKFHDDGFVVHKLHVSSAGGRVSAWFDKERKLLDAEMFDSKNRARPIRKGGRVWDDVQAAGHRVHLGDEKKKDTSEARRDPANDEDARELHIYIVNDGKLYREFRSRIIENLKQKVRAKKYDSALAVKAFRYLVEEGAKKYIKEFGGPDDQHYVFSPATRDKVAEMLRDDFESEYLDEFMGVKILKEDCAAVEELAASADCDIEIIPTKEGFRVYAPKHGYSKTFQTRSIADEHMRHLAKEFGWKIRADQANETDAGDDGGDEGEPYFTNVPNPKTPKDEPLEKPDGKQAKAKDAKTTNLPGAAKAKLQKQPKEKKPAVTEAVEYDVPQAEFLMGEMKEIRDALVDADNKDGKQTKVRLQVTAGQGWKLHTESNAEGDGVWSEQTVTAGDSDKKLENRAAALIAEVQEAIAGSDENEAVDEADTTQFRLVLTDPDGFSTRGMEELKRAIEGSFKQKGAKLIGLTKSDKGYVATGRFSMASADNASRLRALQQDLGMVAQTTESTEVNEVMGYDLKASDRRVIAAFIAGETSAEGKNLELEGDTLRSFGMGGRDYAKREKNGFVKIIADPHGNVSQTFINAIRKMAKRAGALKESVNRDSVSRRIVGETKAQITEEEATRDAQVLADTARVPYAVYYFEAIDSWNYERATQEDIDAGEKKIVYPTDETDGGGEFEPNDSGDPDYGKAAASKLKAVGPTKFKHRVGGVRESENEQGYDLPDTTELANKVFNTVDEAMRDRWHAELGDKEEVNFNLAVWKDAEWEYSDAASKESDFDEGAVVATFGAPLSEMVKKTESHGDKHPDADAWWDVDSKACTEMAKELVDDVRSKISSKHRRSDKTEQVESEEGEQRHPFSSRNSAQRFDRDSGQPVTRKYRVEVRRWSTDRVRDFKATTLPQLANLVVEWLNSKSGVTRIVAKRELRIPGNFQTFYDDSTRVFHSTAREFAEALAAAWEEAEQHESFTETAQPKVAKQSRIRRLVAEAMRDIYDGDSGYGTVYYNAENASLWVVVGDGFEGDEALQSRLEDIEGISQVTVEHEGLPADEDGPYVLMMRHSDWYKKNESIDEGLRSVYRTSAGVYSAKVFWNSEVEEYVVKFYKDGKYLGDDAAYYTNDKRDALDTAAAEMDARYKQGQKTMVAEAVERSHLFPKEGKLVKAIGTDDFMAKVFTVGKHRYVVEIYVHGKFDRVYAPVYHGGTAEGAIAAAEEVVKNNGLFAEGEEVQASRIITGVPREKATFDLEKGKSYAFSNKYGRLTLTAITDVMPIRQMRSSVVPDSDKFDMETAEKIALITDNRHIQLTVPIDGKRWTVVIHKSESEGAYAKITSMNYVGPSSPQKEIQSVYHNSPERAAARFGGSSAVRRFAESEVVNEDTVSQWLKKNRDNAVVSKYLSYMRNVTGQEPKLEGHSDVRDALAKWLTRIYVTDAEGNIAEPDQSRKEEINSAMAGIAPYLVFGGRVDRNIVSRMNSTDLTIEQAAKEAQAWAEKQDDEGPEGREVMKFDDGYRWVDLECEESPEEGEAAKHCGNVRTSQPGDTILSLRNDRNSPVLTIVVNGKKMRQAKGRANSKPSAKYHKYIVALIDKGVVNGFDYSNTHQPDTHFKLADLSPEDRKRVKISDSNESGCGPVGGLLAVLNEGAQVVGMHDMHQFGVYVQFDKSDEAKKVSTLVKFPDIKASAPANAKRVRFTVMAKTEEDAKYRVETALKELNVKVKPEKIAAEPEAGDDDETSAAAPEVETPIDQDASAPTEPPDTDTAVPSQESIEEESAPTPTAKKKAAFAKGNVVTFIGTNRRWVVAGVRDVDGKITLASEDGKAESMRAVNPASLELAKDQQVRFPSRKHYENYAKAVDIRSASNAQRANPPSGFMKTKAAAEPTTETPPAPKPTAPAVPAGKPTIRVLKATPVGKGNIKVVTAWEPAKNAYVTRVVSRGGAPIAKGGSREDKEAEAAAKTHAEFVASAASLVSPYRRPDGSTGTVESVKDIDEVSPPGFSGTIEHMKKRGIESKRAFQLAWSMYKKGNRPHKKPKAHPAGIKNYVSPRSYANTKA